MYKSKSSWLDYETMENRWLVNHSVDLQMKIEGKNMNWEMFFGSDESS
jgi:hypothetical protein